MCLIPVDIRINRKKSRYGRLTVTVISLSESFLCNSPDPLSSATPYLQGNIPNDRHTNDYITTAKSQSPWRLTVENRYDVNEENFV